MSRYEHKYTKTMKNQGNMTPAKKTINKAPINSPKEMEICEPSDKEFRVILLKKFSELQENSDRQLGEKCMNKMRSPTKKKKH